MILIIMTLILLLILRLSIKKYYSFGSEKTVKQLLIDGSNRLRVVQKNYLEYNIDIKDKILINKCLILYFVPKRELKNNSILSVVKPVSMKQKLIHWFVVQLLGIQLFFGLKRQLLFIRQRDEEIVQFRQLLRVIQAGEVAD